ncbi:MAG TPA: TlpA disulfide reductase family protein [Polyangiaceae bacterium]|nr:TlpA disulfide reductase family protein [Polyangiaceae bacterium]
MRIYLRYALFFAAAVALAMLLMPRRSGPKVGESAKPIDLPLVTGSSRFSLAENKGQPLVVEAFASWCSACRSAAPTLAAASRARRARPVRFIGVSVDDSPERARQAKEEWRIPYDIALDDGRFSKDYAVRLLPTLVVIDAEGRVRRVSSGRPSAAELESWLGEVGAERL